MRFKRILVSLEPLFLLALGFGFYMLLPKTWWSAPLPIGLIVLVVAFASIPMVRNRLFAGAVAFNRWATMYRRMFTSYLGIVSTIYLWSEARVQFRGLYPQWHDEYSYMLQAHMVAAGKLWMPAHPLGDAFESFHMLASPVYASIYFPGTALFQSLGVLAGLPGWCVSIALCGCIVAILYRSVAELSQPIFGLFAILSLLAVPEFRHMSTMIMSTIPITFLMLAMYYCWMKWRDSMSLVWIGLLGITSGLAAITRPVDALAMAIPIGVASILKLRREALSLWLRTAAVLVMSAAPFLALQGVLNYGTTGSVLTSPYQLYLRHNQPKIEIGFHNAEQLALPETRIPQKRDYFVKWMWPEVLAHQWENLYSILFVFRTPQTLCAVLPATFLVIFIPIALIRFKDPRFIVLFSMVLVFFALYFFNTFYLAHYRVPLIPVFVATAMLGQFVLMQAWPKFQREILSAEIGVNLLICLWMSPILHIGVRDNANEYPLAKFVHERLPSLVGSDAIVFFRYRAGANFHDEPVYNEDVVWPDEAPIIKVHARDLAGNRDVIAYYARLQPTRTVYSFDRSTEAFVRHGNVAELAAAGREGEIPVW